MILGFDVLRLNGDPGGLPVAAYVAAEHEIHGLASACQSKGTARPDPRPPGWESIALTLREDAENNLNMPARRALLAADDVLRSCTHGNCSRRAGEERGDGVGDLLIARNDHHRIRGAEEGHRLGEVVGEGADDRGLGEGGGF